MISRFIMLEIYCPALEAPFRGHISPDSCTDDRENIRRNTVCTYGCESGHYVTGGDQSVTCQIDGLWNGNVPYCERKCPISLRPGSGQTYKACAVPAIILPRKLQTNIESFLSIRRWVFAQNEVAVIHKFSRREVRVFGTNYASY